MNHLSYSKTDYLSDQDFQVLKEVARRLASKYPPDWLERDGQALYTATLAISFPAAILVSLVWSSWWGLVIPLAVPGALLILLPRLFFGREVGKPRWAHPMAVLDHQDSAKVGSVVKSLESNRDLDIADLHAVVTGDQFFRVWWCIGLCTA